MEMNKSRYADAITSYIAKLTPQSHAAALAWATELKITTLKQTQKILFSKDCQSACCLGVGGAMLGVLVPASKNSQSGMVEPSTAKSLDFYDATLSEVSFRRLLNLTEDDVAVQTPFFSANDFGHLTFREIADAIEEGVRRYVPA